MDEYVRPHMKHHGENVFLVYCNLQRLIKSFAICPAPASVFASECRPPGTQACAFELVMLLNQILTDGDGGAVICAAKY
jgi:hypothetical protein